MPRKARRKSQTNCYHIIIRGLDKLAIFKEKSERTRIFNLIKENYEEYNVKIYAYCIMSNHFHLLLESEMENLALFMSKISTCFAHYYNYRHKRTGYVFQDRYRSQCIENESYFWNCLRYIHLNPVKAGICSHMEDYCYSSVEEYCHPRKDEEKMLSNAAYVMVRRRFETQKDFRDFHKMSDRYFFYDMPEDEFAQRVKIAREILGDMECELNLPAKEILDYTRTRNKFQAKVHDFLKISLREVKEIRKVIENQL